MKTAVEMTRMTGAALRHLETLRDLHGQVFGAKLGDCPNVYEQDYDDLLKLNAETGAALREIYDTLTEFAGLFIQEKIGQQAGKPIGYTFMVGAADFGDPVNKQTDLGAVWDGEKFVPTSEVKPVTEEQQWPVVTPAWDPKFAVDPMQTQSVFREWCSERPARVSKYNSPMFPPVEFRTQVEGGFGPFKAEGVRSCRACGCTDDDCSICIARTGLACHWVEDDLCSACLHMATEGECQLTPTALATQPRRLDWQAICRILPPLATSLAQMLADVLRLDLQQAGLASLSSVPSTSIHFSTPAGDAYTAILMIEHEPGLPD